MEPRMQKPTRAELEQAEGKTVPDILAADLRILFCGINPGLYSGAVGHHFARPGNRFWPALYLSRLTPRRLEPFEERELLDYRLGITNLVPRATAAAAVLSAQELAEGGRRLLAKLEQYSPLALAVLGIGAYRQAFAQPQTVLGLQPRRLAGTPVWVLPNPSGLNAHYRLDELAELFAELDRAVAK